MARLSQITEREALPDHERWVYDDMIRTRGKILPGYAPLLHAAELVGRVVNLGTYFRFESQLPEVVREVIALTVSTELSDEYEQIIHRQGAARSGVTTDVIEAICSRRALPVSECVEAVVVECARQLVATATLTDAAFAAAKDRFGDRGVVEVIGATGFYAMIAYMHNAVQVVAGK